MTYHPHMGKAEALAALAGRRDPDGDRVATLCRQNAELTEEIVALDLALWDAYDRIEELADEARQEGDQHRDYRALLIVALVALALLWGVRGL